MIYIDDAHFLAWLRATSDVIAHLGPEGHPPMLQEKIDRVFIALALMHPNSDDGRAK